MFLLDTNVVSELRKSGTQRLDPKVREWASQVDANRLFLSAITIEELEIGVLRIERRDVAQGAVLREWLENQVLRGFEGRVLSIDLAVARRSARLQVPDPRPARDSLIAATALVHQFTLVTRNISDFDHTGVRLLNPWT